MIKDDYEKFYNTINCTFSFENSLTNLSFEEQLIYYEAAKYILRMEDFNFRNPSFEIKIAREHHKELNKRYGCVFHRDIRKKIKELYQGKDPKKLKVILKLDISILEESQQIKEHLTRNEKPKHQSRLSSTTWI